MQGAGFAKHGNPAIAGPWLQHLYEKPVLAKARSSPRAVAIWSASRRPREFLNPNWVLSASHRKDLISI